MSRASKHLAKEKAKIKQLIEEHNYHVSCPTCGMEIPTKVFLKGDYGTSYICPVCGNNCFQEWKKKNFSMLEKTVDKSEEK